MKNDLAELLLAKVMGWEKGEDYAKEMGYIQAMANYKYDQYQHFSPGMKFIESLALWLDQFKEKEERKIAYDFVKENLIFISKTEMEHLIQIAYDHIIKPTIFRRIARWKGIPIYKIKNIVESKEYNILKRKCLFLGLSDGAHLDFFRRIHGLNNEQVYLTYQIDDKKADEMKEKIKDDLIKEDSEIRDESCTFDFVFLLDDFSGSSDTLLRKETKVRIDNIPLNLKEEIKAHEWGGKLWYEEKEKELVFKGEMKEDDYEKLKSKSSDISYQEVVQILYKETQINQKNLTGRLSKILEKIHELQNKDKALISKQAKVIVILYIATQLAYETLKERKELYKQDWWPDINIEVIQIINNDYKVSELKNKSFEKLLKDYYDESIMDKHLLKGSCDVIHGYSNCSLPLVIYHNTPNNSIYLLWAKTDKIRPLFKRVSRHKVE